MDPLRVLPNAIGSGIGCTDVPIVSVADGEISANRCAIQMVGRADCALD